LLGITIGVGRVLDRVGTMFKAVRSAAGNISS